MKRLSILLSMVVLLWLGKVPLLSAQSYQAGVNHFRTPVPAPDFTLKELGGGELSLKDLRGKVAGKEGKENVEEYRKEFHISSPLLLDDRARVANAYGVWSHPSTFFINRGGKIVGQVFGGRDWTSGSMRNFIQNLLKEKG